MPEENTIERAIRQTLEKYFRDLDGERPHNIYEMLLEKIEKPALEVVLAHTKGNQTRAAKMLGITRSTLHKKMKIHQIH